MPMTQEFYITLPSNVKSSSKFSYNKITNYKTKLNKRLLFPRDEKWCAGLCEISYTKSWFNVRNNVGFSYFNSEGHFCHEINIKEIDPTNPDKIILKDIMFDNIAHLAASIVKSPKMKKGYYEQIIVVIDEINKSLGLTQNVLSRAPQLFWDKINMRVRIVPGICKNKIVYPYLGEELENILGLLSEENESLLDKCKKNHRNLLGGEINLKLTSFINKTFSPEGIYFGPRAAELNAGCHSIYVYSDIIEHTFVGDSFAQLLRTVDVPIDAKYGQTITKIYDTPHFIPLISNSLDSIQIILKDDTGQDIPFECGRVQIKLIIKKNE